ncbi:hypothetical protein [Noviluteimonas gilva]|uniref:Uncharacterized protein n=1 Tax=Noviluteimonas gilva TaxID=2682097 RepID=A0A7C9LKI9_9GAMM|nr:hypothetical protein [Lysobacter gilvus]MUV13544.1 hypothetical protein [Lysobacter gilvus]
MSAFERGYQAGYRAALGAAAAECRKHAEALDHGGNTYTRYGDAIRLASAVLAINVPAIEDHAGETA